MVTGETPTWKTYTQTSPDAPGRAIFTNPLELRLTPFPFGIRSPAGCLQVNGETAMLETQSLGVVPSQNDFDSGPRKSFKIDLRRRVRVRRNRDRKRLAAKINVRVAESIT